MWSLQSKDHRAADAISYIGIPDGHSQVSLLLLGWPDKEADHTAQLLHRPAERTLEAELRSVVVGDAAYVLPLGLVKGLDGLQCFDGESLALADASAMRNPKGVSETRRHAKGPMATKSQRMAGKGQKRPETATILDATGIHCLFRAGILSNCCVALDLGGD